MLTAITEITADDHPDLFADVDAIAAEVEIEADCDRNGDDWRITKIDVHGPDLDPEAAVDAAGREKLEELSKEVKDGPDEPPPDRPSRSPVYPEPRS